jgi:hypothetical protein
MRVSTLTQATPAGKQQIDIRDIRAAVLSLTNKSSA